MGSGVSAAVGGNGTGGGGNGTGGRGGQGRRGEFSMEEALRIRDELQIK